MATELRIIRGDATPEEVAAVVAVLASRSGGSDEESPAARPSLWGRPQLRQPLAHGAGAWKASGLPH